MKSKPYPSQEELHELFTLRDDISQPLIWKMRPNVRIRIGDVAGCLGTKNYYLIRIDRKNYRLHRLIWIYHNGDIPDGMIVDHVDGNRTNNRIENLRLATYSENNYNRKTASNNTSGVKGVYWNKESKKWRAKIVVDHKTIHIGMFHTIEEAETAITAARNNIHGDFARHE